MKRILAFTVALVIILTAFTGCQSDNSGISDTRPSDATDVPTQTNASETTEAEPTTTQPYVDPNAVICDKDGAYFKIIISLYAGSVEKSAASRLNTTFANACSAWSKSKVKDDYIKGQKKGEYYKVEGKEILIGDTNRQETKDVKATLSENQFAVKVVGEKIVLVGYDESTTVEAVEHFIRVCFSTESTKELKIDKNFEYIGEQGLRKVTLCGEATYRVMSYNLGLLVSESVNGEVECLDIIERHLPDVMGLQECNAKVHSKVLSKLPDFYAFANEYHSNGKTPNYTPIIYNTNLLKCLKSDVVWLRGRYTGTNTKSLSWAVFEDNDGNKFALINFHGAVCSNTYKGFENYTKEQLNAQANEWKLDNVAQVIEVKNAILAEFGNIPVLVSGDNNFNSSSRQYENLIAEGFSDAEIVSRVSKKTGYKTSYGYGSTPEEGLSIDHIFGIGNVDFVVHSIVRGTDVWKASDHCPVYVDFNIK